MTRRLAGPIGGARWEPPEGASGDPCGVSPKAAWRRLHAGFGRGLGTVPAASGGARAAPVVHRWLARARVCTVSWCTNDGIHLSWSWGSPACS